ncbi:hypothetical protein [Anaerocolumna aminovalerica]|uniref:hypothetical protein n=1 Tax=Anaerocolumna aminovalerica TaxID=1527 RepID=UPI00248CA7BB|nr:hypothetical protein [Anaerocolumna aminovalerica]
MAKGVYFGVNNVARKVKKLYFGVDGKARKIKKMYFGVDGKARICYSAGVRKVKAMTITYPVAGRNNYYAGACASIGEYLLIEDTEHSFNHIECINSSLNSVYAPPTTTTNGTMAKGAASNSNYAIFAGGLRRPSNLTAWSACYTASLALSNVYTLISEGRSHIGSGTIANNIVFAGGDNGYTLEYGSKVIDIINSSLGSQVRTLPFGAKMLIGLNVGNVLLFAHGDAADSKRTAYLTQGLSVSEHIPSVGVPRPGNSSGAANANYALYQYANSIDVFTSNLAYNRLENFPAALHNMVGLSSDDYAIFAGGYLTGGIYQNTVYSYDKNLVLDVLESLSEAKAYMLADKLGDNGFFIGGYASYVRNTVDIYEI